MLNKIKYFLGLNVVPKTVAIRPKNGTKSNESFYDLKMKSATGEEVDFSSYKGKKVFLVNIASKCGYVGQYDDLEAFYQKNKDNVVVLGFPSNSFAQEPLKGDAVATSCRMDYGVTFPIFEKAPVRGDRQSGLYKWLSDKTKNGWNDKSPKWNFYKYFVDESGELMGYYSSGVLPTDKKITQFL